MPKFAVYSGYQMDRETFMAFTTSLPSAEDLFYHPKNRRNFDHYVLAFNAWKGRLPPKQRRYTPRVRCTLIIFPVNLLMDLFLSYSSLLYGAGITREKVHHPVPTSSFPFALSTIRQAVSSLKGIRTTRLLARRHPQTKPSLIRWFSFWRNVVAYWGETWLPLRIWRSCTPVLIGEMYVRFLPSFNPMAKTSLVLILSFSFRCSFQSRQFVFSSAMSLVSI